MSIRTILFRFFHNGKIFIRYIKPIQNNTTPTNTKIELVNQSGKLVVESGTSSSIQVGGGHGHISSGGAHHHHHHQQILNQPGIQSYFQNARKIFVNNVLNRVTNSLAYDLKRKTVKELLYKNNSSPFFAFVGVSLASGTGILTKEDEFEGVCWEIRHAVNAMFEKLVQIETLSDDEDENNINIADIEIGDFIAKGTNAVIYNAKYKNIEYALKMMFNYDAESNSFAILNAMNKEIIPLRKPFNDTSSVNTAGGINAINYLPPHPNIVVMHFAFTDYIPSIPDSSLLYPSALPARLNPVGGYGRNMSLFILMKKYHKDLKLFLSERTEINIHECILLLTQLLEGITHLNKNNTVHRDLKSDNILLDCNSDEHESCPQLVITDFGNSYTNKDGGNLSMQYSTPYIEKGGNIALMAPEVINAQPGLFSFINYSKSDVWTVGTIAYEIFGYTNPFYKNLKNNNYNIIDLPLLNDNIPIIIKKLIIKMLQPDPKDRPNAELCATICQLYLWAPKQWLVTDQQIPNYSEILQWLLALTTKVLCTNINYGMQDKRRTLVEYQLISTLLQRIQFKEIINAIKYIHNHLTI